MTDERVQNCQKDEPFKLHQKSSQVIILSSQSSAKRCLNAIKAVTVIHINEWRLSLFLWLFEREKFESRSRRKDDRLHIGALLYPYLVVPLWGMTGTLRIYLCGSSVVAYPTDKASSHGLNSGIATNRLPLFVLCIFPLDLNNLATSGSSAAKTETANDTSQNTY